MRSTPSLDRGRFALPRDLPVAAATAATLAVAFLVLGWLTSGLITGVWSPPAQVAQVAGAAVTVATPADRDAPPRPAEPRASATPDRPATVRKATVQPAPEPASRRAPRSRRRAAATPSPAAPAPAVTPTAKPAPVAATAPVPAVADEPVATADTGKQATSERQASQVTPPTSARDDDRRSWRPARSDDDADRGHSRPLGTRPRGHGRSQPVPTPAPSPAPAADDFDWDREPGDGRHHGRGGRWGR